MDIKSTSCLWTTSPPVSESNSVNEGAHDSEYRAQGGQRLATPKADAKLPEVQGE